ncbi:MAG: hypothetical protein COA58_13055 [Bacteroidetes bacterium]|nr:MAG: hypothetical protein COA58_13055 [Bacteroidota bacterium]
MKMKHLVKSNFKILGFTAVFILTIFIGACNKKKQTGVQGSIDSDCEVIRKINSSYYKKMFKNGDSLRIRMPVSYGEVGIPPCSQMIDWIYNPNCDLEIIGVITDISNFKNDNSSWLKVINVNNPEIHLLIEEFDVQDTIDLSLYGSEVKRLGAGCN